MRTLLLFPDNLYKNIKFTNFDKIYLIEDPQFFSNMNYHIIKLSYMRTCMKRFNYYHSKHNITYIEHKYYHQFRDQLKNESEIYMYYPNDLTLKKSYDNVKYIYNLPNFLLSVDDDIYKQNIYRHKNIKHFEQFQI